MTKPKKPEIEPIRMQLDFDIIASLIQGRKVVLCRKNNQPSIELIMDPKEVCSDINEAHDKLEMLWDFY